MNLTFAAESRWEKPFLECVLHCQGTVDVSKDEGASLKALMNLMFSSEALIALSLVTNDAVTSICKLF